MSVPFNNQPQGNIKVGQQQQGGPQQWGALQQAIMQYLQQQGNSQQPQRGPTSDQQPNPFIMGNGGNQNLNPYNLSTGYNGGGFMGPLNNYNGQNYIPTTGGSTTKPGALNGPLFNGGTGKGNISDPTNIRSPANPLNIFAPGSGMVLANMFGNKQSWNPYVDENGNYVWNDPKHNVPVPISSVPGASFNPSRIGIKQANNVQSLTNLMPFLNNAVNNTAVPTAIAGYNASAATSGPYAQLMTDLYNQYGPQLNNIGNQIMDANALAAAQTSQNVINGPGTGLVNSAYKLSQTFDKPWYDTRDAAAKQLQEQLNGGLSGTERDEITKGLARQDQQNGVANVPSQSNTVANAMQYGQAGRNRISQAIQSASAFLPTAKSGVDVFNVATGRPSTSNPGNGLFPGVSGAGSGQQGYGLAGQMFGGFAQQQNVQDQINSQKKDWLDQFNQLASGIGSLANGVSGFGKKGASGGLM